MELEEQQRRVSEATQAAHQVHDAVPQYTVLSSPVHYNLPDPDKAYIVWDNFTTSPTITPPWMISNKIHIQDDSQMTDADIHFTPACLTTLP